MHCSACGTENDDASKFCMGCGRPLLSPAAETSQSLGDPSVSGARVSAEVPTWSEANADSVDASPESPGSVGRDDLTGPSGDLGAVIEDGTEADDDGRAPKFVDRADPASPDVELEHQPDLTEGPDTPGLSDSGDQLGATPPPPEETDPESAPGSPESGGAFGPPSPTAPAPPPTPLPSPPGWGQAPPPAAAPPWGQPAPPPAAPWDQAPPPPAAPAWNPPGPGSVSGPPAAQPMAPAWNQAPAAPAAPPAWGQPPVPAGRPAPAWGAHPPGGPPGTGAPAWGQGPAYGQPAPVAGPADPNGLGAAAGRLGNGARKTAKVALVVAGAVLSDGEVVEAVVAGKLEGNGAVLVLTDQALRLVDDRTWKPVTEKYEVDSGLRVQGWQDDRTASLTLVVAGRQRVLDQIPDRPLAVEMAQRIRYRSGS